MVSTTEPPGMLPVTTPAIVMFSELPFIGGSGDRVTEFTLKASPGLLEKGDRRAEQSRCRQTGQK